MKTVNDSYDLKNMVSDWVDRFNFIDLSVLEKMADEYLFEYIKEPEPDLDEFLNCYSLHTEYEEYLKENEKSDSDETKKGFCEDHANFESWLDEIRGENYPVGNTCFEFKDKECEDVLKAAENAGFGIIQGLEPFNDILFVAGYGYSFYGAHWIPLFLNLPWNKDIKKQVIAKKIEYRNL